MQENLSTTRRLAIWFTAILAIIAHIFQYEGAHFTNYIPKAVQIGEAFQPYSYLLVIFTIILWFTPHASWKRIILGSCFGVSVFALSRNYEFDITTNFPALCLTLLGFVTMFTLPKSELWKKVFIGFLIGVLLGFELKAFQVAEFSEYLKILGTTFIDLIMMIVVPLIFFSLVSGINNMTDNALGRVGIKAIAIYVLSAMFAIALGLIMAEIFNPGIGINLATLTPTSGSNGFQPPKLMQVILHFIPHNALGAMAGAEGKPETVQTVFFAIFVGVTLNLMGEQGKRIVEFTHSAAQLMFKMIAHIIKLAPYAVFGLMAWVTANLGIDAILQLGWLVLCTISGMGVHLIILAMMILFLGRLNPIPFFKKSFEYQALAFSTSSSKATLATAMKIAEEKIGVSRPSTSFVLPLGAAINMDGTAIYLGICAIFFAQAFGIHLDAHHYILIIFTATIASIGAAGYPGGSLVMMSMVLDAIGVPTSGIALLIGVDRILDMFRTTVNVTSDVALTAIIDRSEGTFNETLYYMSAEEIDNNQNLKSY